MRDNAKTIQQILDLIDEVVPNAFLPEVKTEWLSQLDGKIAGEVLLTVDPIEFHYVYPDCAEWNVIVPWPYDDIYETWLRAKIDFANGEYEKYNNSSEMFNAQLREYKSWFLNTYRPGQGYREIMSRRLQEDTP